MTRMETTNDTKRNLPDGWRWVKLGEVCRDISDGTHFTPTYVSEGVPFLSVKDVREEGLSFIDCRYITKEQHHDFCRRCKPEKGDVLYTKVGTTGIAKAIDIDIEFSIFVSVALLKLQSTIVPNYLEKVLNAPVCRTQAENLTQGMANRNLVLKDLKLIMLPLPPLDEQQRIAAVLCKQMAVVEKARAAAQARLEAVKTLPASLLRQVFPQPGQPLPDGWRWVRLGDHSIKVGSGITPRGGQASYHSTGIPLIRSQNVDYNLFLDEGLAFISREQDEAMEGSRVQEGDVLLNITGASIGRVCVVPEKICPANVNQHVSILRFGGDVQPVFLSYYLSTPGFQKFILEAQAGATRQALTKALIEDFQIPFTSLAEQERIAGVLREQMGAVDKARAAAWANYQIMR